MGRLARQIRNTFKWGQTQVDTNSIRITEGKEKDEKRSIKRETLMKLIHLPTAL